MTPFQEMGMQNKPRYLLNLGNIKQQATSKERTKEKEQFFLLHACLENLLF